MASLDDALIQAIGPGIPIADSEAEAVSHVWEVGQVEVALASTRLNERQLRATWRKRKGNRATPLVVLSPGFDGTARVLGPQRADEPIREVAVDALTKLLLDVQSKSRREAAASLTAALERLDRTGIPGILVRGLLTKHVLTRRLRRNRPEDWATLESWASKLTANRAWRENFIALGYQVDPLADRGYVLRHEGQPLLVLHPFADAGAFTRLTDEGTPPEGLLVADCRSERVDWGLLATDRRFRLFPASTTTGAATSRYLEIDIGTVDGDGWPYLGLLAPGALKPGGLLERLVAESEVLGNELRVNVEEWIRTDALPAIARGIGAHQQTRGDDLSSPNARQLIQDASLLVLFRLLFFLYLEGAEYLPLASAGYMPHAATTLLQEARSQAPDFDPRATTLWDRFETLVHTMRTGNTAWGVPAYNGDLFAPDVMEGAEIIEAAQLKDADFGKALAALARDPSGESAGAGVDYGDLEIAHLGRIYEGLLSLRLSFATEPMAYDGRIDRWIPAPRKSTEVEAGELFFQTESGGRKAAGVYYTPQVIVRHLVDNAVRPALETHLRSVEEEARKNVLGATRLLFQFRVVDPAMGSAHFLADALDVIAERIATFLAEHPLKPVAAVLDELRAEARWEGRIEDGDLLRRLVLKHCIYGVDLSRMAVEVGKVSLWLASFVPGLSLAYLGHNLRRGDALMGVADVEVLDDLGPLASRHEKAPIPSTLRRAREVASKIADTADRNPTEVEASRAAEAELRDMTDGLTHAFDVWTSEALGLRGARDWLISAADKVIAKESAKLEDQFLAPAIDMAEDRSFFHWVVEFPEIFARERPGFDVVIGNPPWEELTVEELAFYAIHDPGLRGLPSESERHRRVTRLKERFPSLEQELERRKRRLKEARRYFGPQSGYVAQGAGDPDTYKLFSERYRSLTRQDGWLGVVLPRSSFLVDGARGFRRWLFRNAHVSRLDFILNNRSWAFPIHPQYTIALLAAERKTPSEEAMLELSGPSSSRADFERARSETGTAVRLLDLARWTEGDDGPGYEVPLLPSADAAIVFEKLRGGPSFGKGLPGAWSAFPVRELDETNDRQLFRHKEGVPVWKGRSFDQFNPHGAEPAGYGKVAEILPKLQAKRLSTRGTFHGKFPDAWLKDRSTHPFFSARIAFRDVTNRTNSRTVIACLVPPETFLSNKAPYLAFPLGESREQAFVLGVLNSLVFDWQARRLVETAMNFFILKMLCFPQADKTDIDAIAKRAARLSCVDERFADFAKSCGVDYGEQTDEERSQLRAELDACVAQAYGLTEEDLKVVFSDFTLAAVPTSCRERVLGAFAKP